jgi:hypothetical protein
VKLRVLWSLLLLFLPAPQLAAKPIRVPKTSARQLAPFSGRLIITYRGRLGSDHFLLADNPYHKRVPMPVVVGSHGLAFRPAALFEITGKIFG